MSDLMDYILRMDGGTCAWGWEIRFQSISNEMARKYVERLLRDDSISLMLRDVRFDLFNETTDSYVCQFFCQMSIETR
jgi:hypothetical protein